MRLVDEHLRSERKGEIIMNNSNYTLSLDDTTELRKLIIENPDLPLLCFAGEEAWNDNWAYEQADIHGCSIQELTLYKECWVDKDDYSDRLYDDPEEEYKNLSEEEYDNIIKSKIAETQFVKAIVFYVG
jgi:hypothetical protein